MAVYKRTYKAYDGALTPAWSRFLILPRAGYSRLMQSKFVVIFLMASLFFPLGCVAFIYLVHNLAFLQALNLSGPGGPPTQFLQINANFFRFFCSFQSWMAVLMTVAVAPGLIAPDLANNALALYFSRPFRRIEYVAGKMGLLLFLVSLITWVPGLILFAIQCSLAGRQWARENLWMAGAIVLGLLVWDVFLALVGLALSAWVKWRIAAGGLILGVFFAGAGLGAAFNSIVRTQYGAVLDLRQVISILFYKIFGDDATATALTAGEAWTVLGVAGLFCLWMLSRKVRAFEVIK
jgi:ABC-2 type transport system permease protein